MKMKIPKKIYVFIHLLRRMLHSFFIKKETIKLILKIKFMIK